MKVLVTGSCGFLGRNLVSQLENIQAGRTVFPGISPDIEILPFDLGSDPACLAEFAREAAFVFHLAGVNRPKDPGEFMEVNLGLTSTLLNRLKKGGSKAPVMISSSTQAGLDNPYGQSKRAGEDAMFAYGKETGNPVYVYRFPNLFGKWSRPNYNSAVATFCNNIARGLPITVNDSSVVLNLAYVDDVVEELLRALAGSPTWTEDGKYCRVPVVHTVKLGDVARLLHEFKAARESKGLPDVSDPFTNKLYATYLSFLPEDDFARDLKMNTDARGSFTEILRTGPCGQFSVNISKPHITKGNHWHHTKNEKFVVVQGNGVIRFRRLDSGDVIEYFVSGDKIQVIDIPPGYTHNIENLGDTDMVTFMWCNECFNPDRPDTFFLPVEP